VGKNLEYGFKCRRCTEKIADDLMWKIFSFFRVHNYQEAFKLYTKASTVD
jgi:hypothetical protein